MGLIETLENEAYTIEEARELLAKYEALYIEETDKELSTEYYYAAGVLEARLCIMLEDEKERNKSRQEYENREKELKKENDVLLRRIINEDEKALSKKDIMVRFDKESAWALNLLKLLYQLNLARKIGKEYFTTKNEIDEFMNLSKGKDYIL